MGQATRRTYFVTITFVRFVTVLGFFTFAVAFGVTATDNVHVPTFRPFTVVFDTEQVFFDVVTTVTTTFAPLGTEIFADLLIVEKDIVLPFFTFGITTALMATCTNAGTVVVVTVVVVVSAGGEVTTGAAVVVVVDVGVTAFDATDIPDGPPALPAVATNV